MTPKRRRLAAVVLVAASVSGCGSDDDSAAPAAVTPPGEVLFVSGAAGTGGFLAASGTGEGLEAFDSELSRIADDRRGDGAHGFADFAGLLEDEGHQVREVVEPGGESETGVDLTGAALDGVDVLVLGSNNAVYTQEDVDAVVEFVRRGGGLLVFGDVNYGEDWGDAAASDTQFLAPFGMLANQDSTEDVTTDPADGEADHPILAGTAPWVTLGADVITVTGGGVVEPVVVLPHVAGRVRENPGDGEGPLRDADPGRDAVLAVAEHGAGRVVAFYDRDLFFNDPREPDDEPTAGLGDANNRLLATQMVAWAAGRS